MCQISILKITERSKAQRREGERDGGMLPVQDRSFQGMLSQDAEEKVGNKLGYECSWTYQ